MTESFFSIKKSRHDGNAFTTPKFGRPPQTYNIKTNATWNGGSGNHFVTRFAARNITIKTMGVGKIVPGGQYWIFPNGGHWPKGLLQRRQQWWESSFYQLAVWRDAEIGFYSKLSSPGRLPSIHIRSSMDI